MRWELALGSSFIRCVTAFIIFGNCGGKGCVGEGPTEGAGLDNDIGGLAERCWRTLGSDRRPLAIASGSLLQFITAFTPLKPPESQSKK